MENSSSSYSASSLSTTILISSVAFKFMAMVIGILGNVAVIICTVSDKKEKTTTSYLIVNLALADLLVCLTFYPIWIVEFIQTILGIDSDQDLFCKMSRSSMFALIFVSVATLLAITVDRYLFIVKPLKYPMIVNATRTKIVLKAIWIISGGILCLMQTVVIRKSKEPARRGYCSVLDEIYWPYEVLVVYLPVILIFCMNYKILATAREQKRRIRYETQPHSSENSRNKNASSFRQMIALRSVKTFIIVVVVLSLCCFIPAIIGITLYFFACKSCQTSATWYVIFHFELYGINSIANAFIYGFRHVKHRKFFAHLFTKLCKCEQCRIGE